MVARDPRTAALLDSTDEVRASMAAQGAALAPEFFYKAMSLCNEADLDYRQASARPSLSSCCSSGCANKSALPRL